MAGVGALYLKKYYASIMASARKFLYKIIIQEKSLIPDLTGQLEPFHPSKLPLDMSSTTCQQRPR